VDVELRVAREVERFLQEADAQCKPRGSASTRGGSANSRVPHLEREEEREPAEHLWADDVLAIRVDRETDGAVEMGLEVAAGRHRSADRGQRV
jgi:hypothetical protein